MGKGCFDGLSSKSPATHIDFFFPLKMKQYSIILVDLLFLFILTLLVRIGSLSLLITHILFNYTVEMDVSNILLLQRTINTLFFCSFVQVFLQSSMHLLHLTDIAKLFAKELYKLVCFSIALVSLYLNQHWILSNFSFGSIWYVKQDITLLFLIFFIQYMNIFTYTYWSFLLFFLYIASSYQFFLKIECSFSFWFCKLFKKFWSCSFSSCICCKYFQLVTYLFTLLLASDRQIC